MVKVSKAVGLVLNKQFSVWWETNIDVIVLGQGNDVRTL